MRQDWVRLGSCIASCFDGSAWCCGLSCHAVRMEEAQPVYVAQQVSQAQPFRAAHLG